MGVQKVNGVSLKQLEDDLNQKFESIKGQVGKLQKTIDGLEGHWQGIGAREFNHKQTLINEDISALANLLSGLVGSIHDTRVLSGNTEDDVLSRMRNVDVQGGLASANGRDTTHGSLAPAPSKLDSI